MSKILRRPMFRGGPVDSRGTGITANLGYATGGRVGLNQSFPGTVGQASQVLPLSPGGDLSKMYASSNQLPKFKGQEYFEQKEEADAYVPKFLKFEDFENEYANIVEDAQENADSLIGTEFGTGTFEDKENEKVSYLRSNQGKDDTIAKLQAKQDAEIKNFNKFRDEDKQLKTSTDMFKTPDVSEVDINNLTADTEVSPQDLIKENAELFKELLGADQDKKLKKARISDMSDYALQFFKSTVGDQKGIKEAGGDVAGLALSKDSKTEKVQDAIDKTNDTSTILAINDYIAGKRSKENMKQLIQVAKMKGNIAKGSIGAQILDAAKGGTVTSTLIEQVIKGNVPAAKVTRIPAGSEDYSITKEDEGTFIIEEKSKNAFFIKSGKKIPVY